MDLTLQADAFDETVEQYINNKKNKKIQEELVQVFISLAKRIIDYFNKPLLDKDDIVQELVMYAFEKLPRFKLGKGRAYNYFSVVMNCYYRQLTYVRKQNYNELKARYQTYLKETNG